ncbi:hypothetical protein QTH91_20675 [Variovorax dokdonensis]|uniref:NAD(P)-binding domain-containing protein n=1 Tax=Variovorax dokdonensis TaxID=344883 RepID=A0ABT7NG53_9BURK|nr:hypothetical protein [Variovorax dokdonensis]MDM0046919.1 hypothetical protein [Variovorax dokdonensis]
MSVDPLQALQAAHRPVAARGHSPAAAAGTLLIAGATGALGNELVRRMAGRHRFGHTVVLAREPLKDGLAGVETMVVPPGFDGTAWPPAKADVAIVCFDPPRLYHDRERALWTPSPLQLPSLAHWLKSAGVHTLAVVQPHDQGRLPEALKRGLADLDEQAVAALGFDRLLLVRTARKPGPPRLASAPQRLANWMISTARYMVPSSEQPVRAAVVARFVDTALRLAPTGTHVAAPECVWQAAQGARLEQVVRDWLAVPHPDGAAHGTV